MEKFLLRQRRQTQPFGGGYHPPGVLPRAKQLYAAVRAAVGLQTLEYLRGIVEAGAGRVQGQGAEGNDSPMMPAPLPGPVRKGHVVGENPSKTKLGFIRRQRLQFRRFFDLNGQHSVFLLPCH